MDIEKFTDKARESIGEAQSIAAGMGHQEVDTGHLALALVRQDKGIVPNILQRMGVHVQAFDVALEEMLRKRPSVSGPGMDPSKIMITQRLAQVIKEAQDEAKRMQDEYVSVDHLFCALTSEPSDSPLGRVFAEYKITRVNFVKAMEELRGGSHVTSANPEETVEALSKYSRDLIKDARDGKLDPVIGRDEEIRRVVRILSRRTKNNPVLIGEPGVGKTAIAEGLAQRIVAGDVPFKLRDKEVYLLDLTALVAGTQFRGQFEQRMKGLIDEVKKLGNIILMIDEIHNIVGAGDAEGSMNAANILKPALSRGEIQVIGATTFNEYRKSIEKDSALERRFQPVTVNEPSIEDSIKILKGLAPNYEAYHGVKISDGILRQAVLLSERYITDRFLPDKAIDLIDEACSDLNLKDPDISRRMQLQREIDDFEKERAMLEEQGAQEGAEPDYEQIATLKSKILQRQTELNTLLLKGDPQLTMENIAHVIELWTKIPASKIREEEFQRLSQLEERLKSHIVGQDEAIAAVSAAVRRNRVGISPKHKPVSFIFVGSTGVGKTELVKQLAVDLFNTPDALIRLDMSEFMEKHSVSRIVGSPPGYVGYDEAGQLTEKIRRKPYAVILFDEIEKAHPDVLNVLLQILDDGEITDSHGRRVNFENTIIVMTSNAGSGNQDGGTVGFDRSQTQQDADKAMKALQQFLRPEFINRVDAVITFNRLSKENFKEIAKIMLGELVTSLGDKGITFTYDDSLVEFLVEKSFSRTYGARNLRRTIQKELEDPMATKIIDSYEHPVSRIHAAAENEAIRLDAL